MDKAAFQALLQNQASIATAMEKFMQQMAASNELIAKSLAESKKPQTVRIQKQADGSFVGIKGDNKRDDPPA